MAKVEIKTKEAKARAAMAGGKGKKKKWNKGKVREKLANLVLFDQKTYDKLILEVPKLKLITVSVVSERLKIGASLARAALKELLEKGLIRVLSYHSKQAIYTRATNVDEKALSKTAMKKEAETLKAAKAAAAADEQA